MASICMLAKNSVVRDARILKEADSLASAGHAVTILGLMDAHCRDRETYRDSGVRILRGNHRELLDRSLSAWRLVAKGRKLLAKTFQYGRRARRYRSIFWYVLGSFIVAASFYALTHLLFEHAETSALANIFILGGIIFALVLLLRSRLRRLRPWFSAKADEMIASLRAKAMKKIFRSVLADGAIDLRPDVIHCHDIEPLPAAAAAKRRLGCKLIFDAHEIYEDLAQGSEAIKAHARAILKQHDRDVDGFITINDSIADFYARNYALPRAAIVKNASRQTPPFDYDGRLHEAAGLPLSQRILLYQGGFAEKRGLRTLVQAAAYLDREWTLVMMGWGRLEPVLRELADEANRANGQGRVHPRVVFVPPAPQDDLAFWSAGAHVGAIPYENVGLNHLYCTPNKLWEYPNAGVPILCSPLVEMTKVVKEHGVGWLLPEDDTPSVVAGAVNSLTDDEVAKARAACRRYMDTDNWAKYEARLVQLYEEMELSATGKSSDMKAEPRATHSWKAALRAGA